MNNTQSFILILIYVILGGTLLTVSSKSPPIINLSQLESKHDEFGFDTASFINLKQNDVFITKIGPLQDLLCNSLNSKYQNIDTIIDMIWDNAQTLGKKNYEEIYHAVVGKPPPTNDINDFLLFRKDLYAFLKDKSPLVRIESYKLACVKTAKKFKRLYLFLNNSEIENYVATGSAKTTRPPMRVETPIPNPFTTRPPMRVETPIPNPFTTRPPMRVETPIPNPFTPAPMRVETHIPNPFTTRPPMRVETHIPNPFTRPPMRVETHIPNPFTTRPPSNQFPGVCNTLQRCQKGHIKKEANIWIRMQTMGFVIGIILLFMSLFKCLKVLANNKS